MIGIRRGGWSICGLMMKLRRWDIGAEGSHTSQLWLC